MGRRLAGWSASRQNAEKGGLLFGSIPGSRMLGPDTIDALTPKRLAGDGGFDGWYPYYAGFSSRFAEGALATLGLPPGSTVLDPWVGSGTTAQAALALGHDAVGVDLNPFAVLLAKARVAGAADARSIRRASRRLACEWATPFPTRNYTRDPLAAWLPPRVGTCVRRGIERLGWNAGDPCQTGSIDCSHAFLIVSLAAAARELAATKPASNPTWIRPGAVRAARAAELEQLFTERVDSGLALIEHRQGSPSDVRIHLGDARKLDVATASVDAVLTSPPYCTRIDYAVKTAFELAVLGLSGDAMAGLRRELMGTTSLRADRRDTVPPHWSDEVRGLLTAVREHPSHRSSQYYFPNMIQYFHDADAALSDIARVLKPGADALLVLQTSFYKELEIRLPELFVAMGSTVGLSGEILCEIPLRRVMATINTSSTRYRSNARYRESVVRLSKPSTHLD